MLVSLGIGINALLVSSLSAFMPKYVANQFQIEVSTSALAVGILVTLAALAGILLGNEISNRLKLKGTGLVLFLIASQLAALVLSLGFLFYCPQFGFNGVTSGLEETDRRSRYGLDDLIMKCNADCKNCSSKFEPVCGSDGVVVSILTFFVPKFVYFKYF